MTEANTGGQKRRLWNVPELIVILELLPNCRVDPGHVISPLSDPSPALLCPGCGHEARGQATWTSWRKGSCVIPKSALGSGEKMVVRV